MRISIHMSLSKSPNSSLALFPPSLYLLTPALIFLKSIPQLAFPVSQCSPMSLTWTLKPLPNPVTNCKVFYLNLLSLLSRPQMSLDLLIEGSQQPGSWHDCIKLESFPNHFTDSRNHKREFQ